MLPVAVKPPLSTWKVLPLLATPETVTTVGPVVAAEGTHAPMLVVFQLVAVAGVPLKVILLVPCDEPKLEPVTVKQVPTVPIGTEIELMAGAEPVTVKFTPLLASPATVATILPVDAPFGTGAKMVVELALNATIPVVQGSVPMENPEETTPAPPNNWSSRPYRTPDVVDRSVHEPVAFHELLASSA